MRSDTYFAKRIEESNSSTFEPERDDEFNATPNHIEKVPFKVDKQVLFQDKNVYNAYYNLLMAHRNSGFRYNDILEITDALLNKLEKNGGQ